MRELPTHKGYTVDERLKEFRKVFCVGDIYDIEFISFDSPFGKVLLRDYTHEDEEPF